LRTSTQDRRWIKVLMALLLPMIILLPERPLMADSPSFSVDNTFEREQEYIPGDWNTIDTYTQEYSFNWTETFSARLDVDLTFELQLEDVIRSLDVDEKTVEPSLDLSFRSLVWDLSLLAQDTIDYTNEFNTPRKDSIEYGLELNLFPFYLPALSIESQRILDNQDNLEDKVEKKIDANMDYELTDFLSASLSWKEEITDDRLFDNSDIDSHDWEFNLDYGQTMTSSLKVDFQSNWRGSREDTLNNAGQILRSEKEHEIENNLKFSLDTFPNLESELELILLNDFVEDGDEKTIDFTTSYDQPIVELGTLTETVTITRERIDLTTENTSDLDMDFEIELAGTPDRYIDYSLKYTLETSDHKDGIEPSADLKSQEDTFDLSVTFTPNEKATIENSLNWSVTRENGGRSDSSREILIEGTFDGELLDVPNLTFSPLLELSKEKDFITGDTTDVLNLELEFIYSFVLPPTAFWELSSTYRWEKEEDLARELELTSDFTLELADFSWDVEFEEESTTTIEYDTDEPTSWEHDLTLTLGKDLTPMVRLDTQYTYTYEGDDSNSDEIEADLEWRYRDTYLTFSYNRDRVFENPQDIVRVYTVEISMEF